MQPAGQDPEARLMPGTVTVPLYSQTNASPFWIMLLLVLGRLDNGMIRIWQPDTGVAKMPSTNPIPSVTADQLTRALGEAASYILSQRELMSELGKKSATAREQKIPERKRKEIARKAAKARWRKPKVNEIADR
jgi:hypothetical protein